MEDFEVEFGRIWHVGFRERKGIIFGVLLV